MNIDQRRSRYPYRGLALLLALALLLGATAARAADSGDVLGRPAPGWGELRWLGPPLKLEALRGRVVLIRWWSDECPLCAGTLPGLGHLAAQHAGDGLVVVGVYHPKPSPRPVDESEARRHAERLGLHIPVAIDADWTVLKRWWLSGRPRAYTSVSFLIDRRGVIRWVHKGGELHESRDPAHRECDAAWRELGQILTKVLAEPAT